MTRMRVGGAIGKKESEEGGDGEMRWEQEWRVRGRKMRSTSSNPTRDTRSRTRTCKCTPTGALQAGA
eukprot:3220904-Pyramimonas_sp.AAC.1